LATHKSAEKRARQAVKKNARNTQNLGAVRTIEKKIKSLVALGDNKTASGLLSELMSKSGKAAAKGAINAKTASRRIGRLSARISAGLTAKK
jgi:small subunit ribosomal protein S20